MFILLLRRKSSYITNNGLFTLHGIGARTGNWAGTMGPNTEMLTLVQDRERNLFSIVVVQFPAPVPVPCSVKKP